MLSPATVRRRSQRTAKRQLRLPDGAPVIVRPIHKQEATE